MPLSYTRLKPINKCFYSLSDAEEHYGEVSKDDHGCDIALIEDHTSKEVTIYSVVSEDALRYLQKHPTIAITIKEVNKGNPHNRWVLRQKKSYKQLKKRYNRKLHQATNLHNKTRALRERKRIEEATVQFVPEGE